MPAWRMSTLTLLPPAGPQVPQFVGGKRRRGDGGLRRGADGERRGQHRLRAGQRDGVEPRLGLARGAPQVGENLLWGDGAHCRSSLRIRHADAYGKFGVGSGAVTLP